MITESKHPLVKHKISLLREKETSSKDFREIVSEIAELLVYEASTDILLNSYEVQTPVTNTKGFKVAEKIALVPILRAGLGMLDGAIKLIPFAEVRHIGVYRDEQTLKPVEYYNKLLGTPSVDLCLMLDPMLATGGTAVIAASALKRWGAKRIKFVGLIAAPEGIKELTKHHPDIDIHIGQIDEKLNDDGYIVPGLGDAGDRIFRTV
jgi:uracil phosphoribosyltransferase